MGKWSRDFEGKKERPPDKVSPSLSPLSTTAIKHSLDNRIIKRDFGVNTLLNQHVWFFHMLYGPVSLCLFCYSILIDRNVNLFPLRAVVNTLSAVSSGIEVTAWYRFGSVFNLTSRGETKPEVDLHYVGACRAALYVEKAREMKSWADRRRWKEVQQRDHVEKRRRWKTNKGRFTELRKEMDRESWGM